MPDETLAESGVGVVRPSAVSEGPEPRRKRGVPGYRGALAVAAVLGLLVGSGAVALAWGLSGARDGGAGTFTLVGRVRIAADPGATGTCSGSGPLSDVDKGALVTVYDSEGLVVATGTLGSGAYDEAAACTFPIIVRDVPDDSKSYAVRVGWHPRKDVTNEVARTGELVQLLG
ncbi:hypothetical protein ABZ341_34210 [Streptomyces sp. NPDC006173]|uniref:hypothetical protein n=1 Tax=Streptomyces sp. NPDC006173 TaxID=3155349 RepID=UPI0033E61BE0